MNLPAHRTFPSLFGRNVFDSLLDEAFRTQAVSKTTQGYPVADIYRDGGNTVMEFALAGFHPDEISVKVKPAEDSIVVSAEKNEEIAADRARRIARRSFQKSYINHDKDLSLEQANVEFENGLLTITIPPRATEEIEEVELF